MRRLRKRGLGKAREHCLLSATALNLKRMVKLLTTRKHPGVSLRKTLSAIGYSMELRPMALLSTGPNGIPILDLQGHERFRMPDGGKLKAVSPNGRSSFWTIRYLDTEQAVLFDELRQSSIHAVQELPEWAAKNGLHLLPLDPPMRAGHKPHRKVQER